MALARIVTCAFSVVLLIAPFALARARQPVRASPQQYYLALGDSLTYGIQPAKVDAGLAPSGFATGFVDVFARRLRLRSLHHSLGPSNSLHHAASPVRAQYPHRMNAVPVVLSSPAG